MSFKNLNLPTVEELGLSSEVSPSDDEEDTLSLCDLPLTDNDAVQEPKPCLSPSSFREEDFEFVVVQQTRSSDFHSDRFSSRRAAIQNAKQNALNARLKHSSSVKSYRQQNATTSTKHVVMFGKAAIPIEMGLTDIRKRQGRRTPTSLFPADNLIVSGGGNPGKPSRWGLFRLLFRTSSSSGGKSSSSGFGSAWARSSISCISSVI